MNFFDTHAHLNFKAFDRDRDEVISRSLKEGVFMINVGSDYETSKLAVEIAEKYQQGVWAAVALHPIHVANSKLKSQISKSQLKTKNLETEEFDYNKYKTLAMSSKKIVAIGETGLDAMYPNPNQEQVFLEHLRLAKELDLPVILHCRKAHKEMIKALLTFYATAQKVSIKGVLHCFTGRWSDAKQYLDMGLYLGFNGIIYKMDLAEAIKKTPLERILIETDCPYLIPLPAVALAKAGPMADAERNEPLFVKHIVKTVAEIRGEPIEKIVEATFQNAKKLFNIKDVKD